MANRKQIKASELTGFNVYQDPKHGTVVYDWISKKGFQLTTSDVRWYTLSQAFLPVAIVLIYICYSLFKLQMLPSIIIGIVSYIVMKVLYRVKFLNTLPCVENYKRPNNSNLVENAAEKYSKIRLIILLVLSIALVSVSTIYYIFSQDPMSNVEKIGVLVMIVASIGLLLFTLITLIVQKKKQSS